MSDASDLQINFPVKSVAIAPSLVLPRRRSGSRSPFAAVTETDLEKITASTFEEPPPLPAAVRNETKAPGDGHLKEMERALREFESQLNDRQRVTLEHEKRLAQRERDLVQAETALWSAIEALQKIKSALHARAD